MVKTLLDIPKGINKRLKAYMVSHDITDKREAIIKLLDQILKK